MSVWVPQNKYRAVGMALSAAREEAGLSQKQLAIRLAKPQSFVSNYERGQRRIDVLELILIAEALKCDPRGIFGHIFEHQRSRPSRRKSAP
jgi:transcriptional regulator with XRE-family HTH domain